MRTVTCIAAFTASALCGALFVGKGLNFDNINDPQPVCDALVAFYPGWLIAWSWYNTAIASLVTCAFSSHHILYRKIRTWSFIHFLRVVRALTSLATYLACLVALRVRLRDSSASSSQPHAVNVQTRLSKSVSRVIFLYVLLNFCPNITVLVLQVCEHSFHNADHSSRISFRLQASMGQYSATWQSSSGFSGSSSPQLRVFRLCKTTRKFEMECCLFHKESAASFASNAP